MSRIHYPPEYREQIIKLAQAGRKPAALAREFKPSVQTIRKWIAEANGTAVSEEQELRRENRQLRKHLAKVEEENAILAKAAAWFAKETLKTPDRSSSS